MLLVCTRMLLVCTRMYLYVTRMYSCGVLVTISSKPSERERFECHYLINKSECCIYFVNTNREKSAILKARADHSLLRLVVTNKNFS